MSDDLISRQTLRIDMYNEVFEKGSDEQRWDSGCWIRYKMFERVVDRQPSAQRTGRWIDAEKAPFDMWYATCSECGKRQTLEYLNYCPNCGHPMEVEK